MDNNISFENNQTIIGQNIPVGNHKFIELYFKNSVESDKKFDIKISPLDTNTDLYIQNITYKLKKISKDYTISLSKGWNILSNPFDENISIDTFCHSDINSIWTYKDGKWYAWSPYQNIYQKIKDLNISLIKKIDQFDGFWIYSNKDNITLNGYKISSKLPSKLNGISKSWVLKGINIPVTTDVLLTLYPDIYMIWTYKDGKWFANSPDTNISQKIKELPNVDELNKIDKNQGIWIRY